MPPAFVQETFGSWNGLMLPWCVWFTIVHITAGVASKFYTAAWHHFPFVVREWRESQDQRQPITNNTPRIETRPWAHTPCCHVSPWRMQHIWHLDLIYSILIYFIQALFNFNLIYWDPQSIATGFVFANGDSKKSGCFGCSPWVGGQSYSASELVVLTTGPKQE